MLFGHRSPTEEYYSFAPRHITLSVHD
jgi:hypothetical protein